jgi:tetratricopeptide (TPR) repeat protein
MSLLLVALMSCGGGELGDVKSALEAWDAGKAHLEAGRVEAAAADLGQAAALDPESPALWAWRAQVRLDMGDEPGALALVEEGVRDRPRNMPLRHLRAVLRLRAGDLVGGASDLRRLEESGWLDPLDAGADPDLAVLGAHPEHAMLVPTPPLEMTSHGPEGAVLLGDRIDVELVLVGPPPERLQAQNERTGLLALEAIVETVARRSPRVQQRTLRLQYRAVVPGRGSLGPWAVTVGDRTAYASAMDVEVKAVGQRRQAGPAWEPPLALPSRRAQDGLPPSGEPGARLELREDGTLRWEGVLAREAMGP